jgi:hypothetical protein
MVDREGIRSITERLVQSLEGSRVKKLRTPLEIAVTELELTDISERILDEINSELVNFKLGHRMVSAEHVD